MIAPSNSDTVALAEWVTRNAMLATVLVSTIRYDLAERVARQASEEERSLVEVARAIGGFPEKGSRSRLICR